jgi:hypothetical protein
MGCKLVEGKSEAELTSLRLLENRKIKLGDFKIAMMCGNRNCIAAEHIRMIPQGKKTPLPPARMPDAGVSTYRLTQIAFFPWQAPTEEETEAMALELIERRKRNHE